MYIHKHDQPTDLLGYSLYHIHWNELLNSGTFFSDTYPPILNIVTYNIYKLFSLSISDRFASKHSI